MSGQKGINEYFKKFWFLLWKDDSLKGWIFSVVFLFLLIKFIFFPFLGMITGTSLPLAIVESCSMYHQDGMVSNLDIWWENQKDKYEPYIINKLDFENFHMSRGFNKGDILFIVGTKPEKLEVGDIIIFDTGQQNPIIHRIINISSKDGQYVFSTMGDNNNGQLASEKQIYSNQLVGKASFRLVPFLGWVKLMFYERIRPDAEKGFCEER